VPPAHPLERHDHLDNRLTLTVMYLASPDPAGSGGSQPIAVNATTGQVAWLDARQRSHAHGELSDCSATLPFVVMAGHRTWLAAFAGRTRFLPAAFAW
jgi:hypothetical protein